MSEKSRFVIFVFLLLQRAVQQSKLPAELRTALPLTPDMLNKAMKGQMNKFERDKNNEQASNIYQA